MKRNTSLAAIGGTIAILAIATFGNATAQTTITTFKKGSPEAARELNARAAVAVNAEAPAHDKGERGTKRMEQMQQRLNLTADQTAKIQTILQNAREKGKAAREQAAGDKAAFKTAMKESMKNTDAEIKGVLTAEQAQKYAELKAEMKAKHHKGEGRGEHRGHENHKE